MKIDEKRKEIFSICRSRDVEMSTGVQLSLRLGRCPVLEEESMLRLVFFGGTGMQNYESKKSLEACCTSSNFASEMYECDGIWLQYLKQYLFNPF